MPSKSSAAALFQGAGNLSMVLRLGLVLMAVMMLPACNLKLGQQPPVCGDFLKQWGATPPQALRFEGCKKEEGQQADKLIATYWLSGKDAVQVEQYLVKTYQMAPLIFQWCGWVSTYGASQPARDREGFYRDKNGHQFDISMASVETVEKDWKKIPRFNVRIETYLGEI
jgi:hypothetical protein